MCVFVGVKERKRVREWVKECVREREKKEGEREKKKRERERMREIVSKREREREREREKHRMGLCGGTNVSYGFLFVCLSVF
jgi:hypothetical protein